jgi:hypothetical protein
LDGVEMTLEMGSLITLFLGWTGGLVAIAGYFIKKWMTSIENKHKESVIAVATVARDTAAAVATVARDTAAAVATVARDTAAAVATINKETRDESTRQTAEIKDGIKANRDEYIRVSGEIKTSIDTLAEHQRVANGRTGSLESKLERQVAICETVQALKPEKKSKKVKGK